MILLISQDTVERTSHLVDVELAGLSDSMADTSDKPDTRSVIRL